MRVCPSCGTMNESNARFCENCGFRLEEEAAAGHTAPDPAEIESMGTEESGYHADPAENEGGAVQDTVPFEDFSQYGGQQGWEEPVPQSTRTAGKLSKLQKIVIAEAVCLVVVIITFFAVGNNKYSAQSVAENYFDAFASRDWKTVYGLLELPEGSFMQESQFEEMMDKMQMPEITNYTVRGQRGSEEEIVRNFSVEYSATGQGTSNMELALVRQSDKALFFFDVWKVSTEGMLSEGYPITVPAGAQVAVDGIRLTDEYRTESDSDGMDTYEISVFNGIHSISIAAPWCEVYQGEFDTSLDGSLTVSSMTLSEAGESALEAKMQETLETFYAAAMSEVDYSEVEGLFTADTAGDYETEYNDLKDALNSDVNDYYTLNKITFDNFQCDFYVEQGAASGSMECDYTVDYTYRYDSFSGTRTENRTSDSTAYMTASFVYEGDTYKLQDVSIPTVWW